jgi:hypothetical protein
MIRTETVLELRQKHCIFSSIPLILVSPYEYFLYCVISDLLTIYYTLHTLALSRCVFCRFFEELFFI